MSENPIAISNLNDFIFCPASIYFHQLGEGLDKILTQEKSQIDGSHVHEAIDENTYSTKKSILQSFSVYSEEFNLIGKIDIFDLETGTLTERKNKINYIYDGYIFQLYAQYFALKEMGYQVKKLRLYSYQDNKNYSIQLPEKNPAMMRKFRELIIKINNFDLSKYHPSSKLKCVNCIYNELCDRTITGNK